MAGRLGASEASVTAVFADGAGVVAPMDFSPASRIELIEDDEEAPFDSSGSRSSPTTPTRLPVDDAPAAAQHAENIAF
jgi:hypothetical protein